MIAAFALTGGLLTACSSSAVADPVALSTRSQAHSHAGQGSDLPAASAEASLYSAMRTLWDQHMAWTWSTVVAFAEDSPALDPTIARLLANQADIGDAIAPFYGEDAAAQLTELLQTHITLAVPVLTAAEAGDTDALDAALDDWYANARDIADFLAAANHAWAKRDLRDMMETHITQTTAYAAAVLAGDYESAIATFDEAQAHMAEMADMLSAGLIAQFLERF
ncbi:hypothetical protein GCM10010932_11640 [Agromyces flavus]|nr:hypothetical protein GCM10010932_11640 [Agromyces flavus]